MKKLMKHIKRGKMLKTVREAGRQHNKLQIKYKKLNGEVVTRVVSPYEIKKHNTTGEQMLYLSDTKSGAKNIKAFKTKNIVSVKPLKTKFRPHWEVKL